MDAWSLRSHQHYQKAFEKGVFKEEIVPYTVEGPKGVKIAVDVDQAPRPDTTIEN